MRMGSARGPAVDMTKPCVLERSSAPYGSSCCGILRRRLPKEHRLMTLIGVTYHLPFR